MTFRRDIARRLSGSLRRDLNRQLEVLYQETRADLGRKLELLGEAERVAALPETCPYTLDQVLGDFWPERKAAGGEERTTRPVLAPA